MIDKKAITFDPFQGPNLDQFCYFQALDVVITFELKSRLIHLLSTFHGLTDEDPHKYLKEFHMICTSIKSPGVTEEQIKLRAFLVFFFKRIQLMIDFTIYPLEVLAHGTQ